MTPAPAVGSFDATLYADQPAIWLKLADATGSGTVRDFSGNGNTGTVAGGVTLGETGPITVMPLDTSALFNGSSGKITTTYNPADNGVAVEALVNVASTVTGVVIANSSTARTGGLILGLSSGKPYVTFGNGTSQATATAGSALSTGAWHHLVGTWDGGNVRIYVDGVWEATASLSGSLAVGQTDLAVGVNPDGSTGYFAGYIAEVAFFLAPLTPIDIANRFELVTGGYAAPALMVQAALGQNPFTASTPGAFTWTPLPNVLSFTATTGRQHELQRFEAGTASVTFLNTDGRYSPWNTNSPYSGDLVIAVPIQITASYGGTVYPLFYGYAQSWTPKWLGSGYCDIVLSLYDGLQFLSLFELGNGTLYPGIVESDGAVAFWRFSDSFPANPASATAADSVNSFSASVTGLTVGTQAFGQQGPVLYDPATALTISNNAGQISLPSSFLNYMVANSGSGFAYDFWIDNVTKTTISLDFTGSLALSIQEGVVVLNGAGVLTGTTFVGDGLPHHVCVSATSNSGTATLYVDGVSQGTLSLSYQNGFSTGFPILISNGGALPPNGGPFTLSNLAYYTNALTQTQVTNHYTTGYLLQFVQSTGARIGVVLEDLSNVPSGCVSLASGVTTQCQGETSSVVGTKALDYIDVIVQTEQSEFFQAPNGVFTFYDRYFPILNTLGNTSQLTFSNDPANPGVQYEIDNPDLSYDDLDFWPINTVTRINGIEQIAENAAAIASGLARQQDITGLYYTTDVQSLNCAQWLTTKYGEPLLRVQGIVTTLFDEDGSAAWGGSTIAGLLALGFMYQVTVRRITNDGSSAFQQSSLIEGIEWSVQPNEQWSMTLRLQPYDIAPNWFVLGTSSLAGGSDVGVLAF